MDVVCAYILEYFELFTYEVPNKLGILLCCIYKND